MNVLTKAFSDEKRMLRERMESLQMTLEEYNKTCTAEIERLKKESGHEQAGEYYCDTIYVKVLHFLNNIYALPSIDVEKNICCKKYINTYI